ncbi:probable serine/threonine-protein kinase, partial [Tanacetum coccineum]
NRYNNGALSHWLSNPINDDFNKLVTAGWPPWLASVVGEALNRWSPCRANTFEKIGKIGEGRHSFVYKARDISTGMKVDIATKRLKVYSNKDEMEFAVEVEILIQTYDRS